MRELVDGLLHYAAHTAGELDPVVAAAVLAFGFVYIHPFADGNGRIHRYLIHHVLAQRGLHPPGIVFPISAAILENVVEYERVLESYSSRLLPVIEWQSTPSGNVRVLNDTADFYRYFDATPHAEFLYGCVRTTIADILPAEAEYLARYDRFSDSVKAVVDMPDSLIDLAFRFLHQNDGVFSKRARTNEFSALTDEESGTIEAIYRREFDDG